MRIRHWANPVEVSRRAKLCFVRCLTAPLSMLITRIRPSIWVRNEQYPAKTFRTQRDVQIPTMEVIWSVLTMVLASAKNFETLVAVRFFVGTWKVQSP